VTREERMVVASFPENTMERSLYDMDHLIVISRDSGRSFYLSDTVLDIKCKHHLREFVIEDVSENRTRFRVGRA